MSESGIQNGEVQAQAEVALVGQVRASLGARLDPCPGVYASYPLGPIAPDQYRPSDGILFSGSVQN